jgi:hypothetical protein
MKNLNFTEVANPGNKTKRWLITSARTGEQLAYIEFRSGWRKYVWGMLPGVIFDVDCTIEVTEFLKQHAQDRQ